VENGPNGGRSGMGSCLVADAFCTPSMKRTLLDALERAASRTSVPMRLYLERHCAVDPIDRAGELFLQLTLDGTADETTVLLYVAVSDGKLAFVCDRKGDLPGDLAELALEVCVLRAQGARAKAPCG